MSDELKGTESQATSDSVLDLADDAFMDMDYSEYESTQASQDAPTEGDDEPLTNDDPEAEDSDAEAEEDALASEEDTSETEDEAEGDTETQDEDSDTDDDATDTGSDETEIDHKAELEKLFTPFKANGKEIKVDNVDEAITLMQMGANYNKKMAALKPNLKILKTLENNGLLEQGKLDYLIDLDKKNPEAIKKLLKESGIDPLDIDTNSEEDYKPKTYTVDDKEIELDAVLEEIQDTPTYSKTIDIIGNKWDGQSREIMVNNPSIIKAINEHMGNGVFEQVTSLMEKERVMGRLEGMSDLEAYKYIGDQLFANQAQAPITENKPEPIVKRPVSNKPDPKLANRKKAASTTKSRPAATTQTDYNPLGMSDEEFEKSINAKFL